MCEKKEKRETDQQIEYFKNFPKSETVRKKGNCSTN